MSQFSGKCDCYDSLVQIHNCFDEQWDLTIYVGDRNEPLQIKEAKDLIPYYPHLISSSAFHNEKHRAVVHLSREPYPDREERQCLERYKERLLKIWRRCKRKKIDFDVEDAVNEVCFMDSGRDVIRILAERVKDKKQNAELLGLHFSMWEYYRQKLVDEMLKHGLKPADYGYGRFVQ